MRKRNLSGNERVGRRMRVVITFLSILITAFIPQAISSYSYALPEGAQVQNGEVSFDQPDSNTMNISASNQSIINWQSFNIAQNETVNFIQPLNSATVLNRVIGGGMSDIAGALNSNGIVILINPAGINFAPGANVNVGGLIASSLDISDENFLASNYVFEHMQGLRAGQVINSGHIAATRPGAVVGLVGDVVKNDGAIVADLGTVALASGNKVTMKFDDTGFIQFDVTEAVKESVKSDPTFPLASAVSNTGTIKADGGHVILSAEQASNLFEKLVNQEGHIEANAVAHGTGGSVILRGMSGAVRDSGEIHAEGVTGGEIKILGRDVKLEGALLNASGSAGGGLLLIGGNYQGKGPEPNALHTFVSADSVLKADALSTGNGGKVIVWGDNSTLYYGSLSARGGAQSGDGGFAEVSGKEYLDFDGRADLLAPHGTTGTLLLDPNNITISTGADANMSSSGGDPNTYTTTANSGVLNTGTLNTALVSASVIVLTGTAGANSQTGDITVSGVITASANANSLTLSAHGSIAINANVNMSAGSGNLTLIADNDASGAGAITQGGGSILMGTGDLRMTAGSGIGTNAANILTQGLTNVAAATSTGGIFISNSVSGNINVTTVGATVGFSTTTGAASTGGNISVINNFAGGTITVSSVITGGANATGSTGNIILTTTGAGAANIVVNANITSGAASQADAGGGQTPTSGNITLTAGGTGTITGTGAITTGTAAVTGAAGGGVDTATSGNITLVSGGTIGLSNATAIVTGAASRTGGGAGTDTAVVGNISLTAAGEINNGTVSTAMTITEGTPSGASTNTNGTLAITTTTGSGNAFLSVTGVGRLAASSISNNLTLTTTGAITQTGALTITGTSSFTAGANAITLTTATNDFTGAVSLSNSGANAVSVTDTNAIVLGTISVGTSTLTITATGTITQSGATTITQAAGAGTASFTAGANAITLTNANDFTGAVALSNSGANAVAVTDTNAIILGTISVGTSTLTITATGSITQSGVTTITQAAAAGTASFTAGSNAITLTSAGNNFTGAVALSNSGANNVSVTDTNAIILGTISVGSGTLTITAGGNNTITQTGAITQAAGAGTATFTTGNAAITLTNAGNDFTGAVSLNNGGNNAVSITDTNSLVLGTCSLGPGAFNIVTSGSVTQTGAITASGTTTLTVGSTNDITLTNVANNFGAISIVSANNVSIVDTNSISFANCTISGTLNVTSDGILTDSGSVAVTGTASFDSGGSNINLNSAGNNFSTVIITSGNNVTLVDTNAIILGASTVSGTLSVTASGTITDSGALVVSGTATFAAGATNDITLDSAANNFSTVIITSGNNVTLVDTNGIDLGAGTVSGTLNVTAGGAITDSGGTFTVTGTATFAAGAANNITLDKATNNYSTVSITSGNNVTLVDTNAIILGASTVSGTFSVTAGGAISQSGAATVTGTTTMTSGAGTDITLTNGGNSFTGVLTLSGDDISVTAAATMTLGAITSTGAITLTTTGGGSILDGNGATNNLTAVADSSLTSAGIIGTEADPLEVTVTGATLTVAAGAKVGLVSVDIDGSVTPSGTLVIGGTPPGRVIFNGSVIYDPFAVPAPAAPLPSDFAVLDSLNEMNQLIAEQRDKMGITSDPFLDRKRWSIKSRPHLPRTLPEGVHLA